MRPPSLGLGSSKSNNRSRMQSMPPQQALLQHRRAFDISDSLLWTVTLHTGQEAEVYLQPWRLHVHALQTSKTGWKESCISHCLLFPASTTLVLHKAKLHRGPAANELSEGCSLFAIQAWLRVVLGYHTTPQVAVGWVVGASSAAWWWHLGQTKLQPALQQHPSRTLWLYGVTCAAVAFFVWQNVARWVRERLQLQQLRVQD